MTYRPVLWYLLLLYYFVVPWSTVLTNLPIPLTRVIGYGIALAIPLEFVTTRSIALPAFHRWLLVFLTWSVLSLGWAESFYYPQHAQMSTNVLSGMFKGIVLIVSVWQIAREPAKYHQLVQALLLGYLCAIAFTLTDYLEHIAGSSGGARSRWRYAGVDSELDPNNFAVVLAASIALAWDAIRRLQSVILKGLGLTYMGLAAYAIALAASRAGVVCALVAIIPLLLRGRTRTRLALATLLGILAAAYFLGFVSLPSAAYERLSVSVDEVREGKWSGRLDIWQAGFEVFLDNFLVGIGVGGYQAAMVPFFMQERGAHNTLLAVATETGVVGLALYCVAMWLLLRRTLEAWRRGDAGPLGCFLALILGGMTLTFQVNQVIWALLALLYGITISAGGAPARAGGAPAAAPLRARFG